MKLQEVFRTLSPVFSLTLVGYFCAYIFEIGYLRHFNLSWQSAHVTINSFIIATIVGAGIGFYIKEYLYPLMAFLRSENKTSTMEFFKYHLYFILFITTSFVAFTYLLTRSFEGWHWGLILTVGYSALELVLAFIMSWRPGRGSKHVFNEWSKRRSKRVQRDNKHENEFTQLFETLFRLIFFLGLIFAIGGMFLAQSLKTVRIFEYEKKSYAVIREYDNLILAKEFDNGTLKDESLYISPVDNPIKFQSNKIRK